MDRFQERLANSSAHGDLRSLKDMVGQLPDHVASEIEQTTPGLRERVAKVVEYAEGVLAMADAQLIPPSTLGSLQTHASVAATTATALSATPGNAPVLDQQLDDLLVDLLALGVLNPVNAKTARAVGDKLASAATAKLVDLESRANGLDAELDEIEMQRKAEVEALSSAIDQERATWESTSATINQALVNQQAEVTIQVASFTQQYQAAEINWNAAATQAVAEVRAANKNLEDELTAEHATLIESQTESGEAALARVQDIDERVNALYQAVAQTGTAGAYGDDAKEQRKAADQWRWGAVIFASSAVVTAIVVMIHYWHSTNTSVADVATKTAVVVGLGVIAAYAARQSGQHRHREERSKRLQLQLVSFEPFVKQLDPADQSEARREFVVRVFDGEGGSPLPGSFDAHDFGGIGPDLAKALITVIAGLGKK
jgi:hypothetical protein